MAIYPPILQSSHIPFTATLTVSFNISDLTNVNDIKHLQIKVNEQGTNKPVKIIANGTVSQADNIAYVNYENNIVNISAAWTQGKLYKAQLRFGTS